MTPRTDLRTPRIIETYSLNIHTKLEISSNSRKTKLKHKSYKIALHVFFADNKSKENFSSEMQKRVDLIAHKSSQFRVNRETDVTLMLFFITNIFEEHSLQCHSACKGIVNFRCA